MINFQKKIKFQNITNFRKTSQPSYFLYKTLSKIIHQKLWTLLFLFYYTITSQEYWAIMNTCNYNDNVFLPWVMTILWSLSYLTVKMIIWNINLNWIWIAKIVTILKRICYPNPIFQIDLLSKSDPAMWIWIWISAIHDRICQQPDDTYTLKWNWNKIKRYVH